MNNEESNGRSLRALFDKLLNEYIDNKNSTDPQRKEFSKMITKGIPNELFNIGIDKDKYMIKGSVGIGRWTYTPWIAIFNKDITATAQEGVYIVYIQSKDASSLYLTLNQGCSKLKNDKGQNEAGNYLRQNAGRIRQLIGDIGFSQGEIKLGENLSDTAELYQSGTVYYKKYNKGQLPSDDVLKSDLENLLNAYDIYANNRELIERGEPTDMSIRARKENFNHNIILYGPPGTGKTYNAVYYAVAICENKTLDEIKREDYNIVLERYKNLKENKRIAFTTFHQSYGYEQFIEGIRPHIEDGSESVTYSIQPGIFKQFCSYASKQKITENPYGIAQTATIWKVTVRNKVQQDCFENNSVRIDYELDENGALSFVYDIKEGDIIITTNGSRSHINGIAVVTDNEAYTLEEEADNRTARNVKWLATGIDEDITEINDNKWLHRKTAARVPSMKVADIVQLAKDKNPQFRDIEVLDNTEPYVFIIDEINRGNISKIFGELITLIEDTKRAGAAEAMEATLPYSGDTFSVPQNVYILGTMNTADRSIALMDTALRRRFNFVEFMPDSSVLSDIIISKDGISVDVGNMLDIINQRITFLYDREHTIGHAFFTKLKDTEEGEGLDVIADIFKKNVIPLLQEYFYEDYKKIRMVLGDDGKSDKRYEFITEEKIIPFDIFNGGYNDYDEKAEYTINNDAFKEIKSYNEIIKRQTNVTEIH